MSDATKPQGLHKLLKGISSAQMGFVAQAAAQLMPTSITVTEPTTYTVSKTSTTIVKKKGTVSSKATRPLNSFIAFRSYCAKIFPGVQQKQISGLLTFLWQNDHYKAKWSVLAKAYSIIRDIVGKDNAPLDLFLTINTPFVGIVDGSDYLAVSGYEMACDEHGVGKLVQIPKTSASSLQVSREHLATNVSVDDIISNCVACGYVNGDQLYLAMPADQATLTMTTSASSIMASQANHSPPQSTQAPQAIQSSTYGSSAGIGNDQVLVNFLDDETARMDSEMKTMTELVDAPVIAPSPHGWNLDAHSYDPYQGNAFNAFNIAFGMDDPTLFEDYFNDPEFTKMMDQYFF